MLQQMEWVTIQTNRKGKNKVKVAQLHSNPKLQHIKLCRVTLQYLHHISPSMEVPFLVQVLCGFIIYRILHCLRLEQQAGGGACRYIDPAFITIYEQSTWMSHNSPVPPDVISWSCSLICCYRLNLPSGCSTPSIILPKQTARQMGTGVNNVLHFSLLSPQPYNFLVSNRLLHVESRYCQFIFSEVQFVFIQTSKRSTYFIEDFLCVLTVNY